MSVDAALTGAGVSRSQPSFWIFPGSLGQGLGGQVQPKGPVVLATWFVNKVLLGHSHRHCLDVVRDCFPFTMAELSGDETGWL